MAGAFQSGAFQASPAFQTGDATVTAPTPGNKLPVGEYQFDRIAREQRERLREAEEARRIEIPAPPADHELEPEQPVARRSKEQQRADAERRLFQRAQERAERARYAEAERMLLESLEQDRLALVALQRQREEEAIALQLALDEEAAQAFLAFLMELP